VAIKDIQGLSEEEFENLSKSIEELTFRRNELLFEENRERKDLFLIYEGEVETLTVEKIWRGCFTGKNYIIGKILNGQTYKAAKE